VDAEPEGADAQSTEHTAANADAGLMPTALIRKCLDLEYIKCEWVFLECGRKPECSKMQQSTVKSGSEVQ
jgi:hypothetical protein